MNDTINKMSMNIKYEQPPINEVVFGCDLVCANFQTVHQGMYWEKIKKEFPSTSSQQLIYNPNEPHTFGALPYSRAWYESSDRQRLIQLQHDKFLFNWRQLSSAQSYPSFESLFPEFKRNLEDFKNWANSCSYPVGVQTGGFELTYINHFDSGLGWNGSQDTHKIIKAFGYDELLQNFTPKLETITSQFVSKSGADIIFGIRQGLRRNDSKLILIVEITIRQKGILDLETWFREANANVNSIFNSVLTDAGKRLLGKK